MKERKNIDRLYQEKFRDYNPEPKPELWNSIAGKLNEKDEKRPFIIPLWMKIGGVAAVLALMLSGYFFSQNNFTQTRVVFEIEEEAKPNINFPDINTNTSFTIASELLSSLEKPSTSTRVNQNIVQSNTAIAANTKKSHSSDKTYPSEENREPAINTSEEKNNKTAIAEESESSSKDPKNKVNPFNPEKQADKDITEAIAENNSGENRKFSPEEPNALAELEKEKRLEEDEERIATVSKKKLRLSTFAAPVFYDNIGSGSAIDPEFAGNKTNSEVSMAYGMNLAYAISDKIKIRSGISKVSMSYNIEDIVFSPGVAASSISIINDNKKNNPQLNSVHSGSPNSPNSESQFDLAPLSRSFPGELNQQFGFIEVPLEIEYNLLDKKVGLNIIAGGSSLFLDENSIQVNANNQNTRLGEAKNINKVSFSTNIGVGLDYKLFDNFKLNVEPIFKYQLETFDDAPGVKPFYFGVYSGVSFSF
ncbi:hypothetical protein GUB10_14070 [Salegentibacter sp. BLCTC]|uniref:hypothetical protein n=1 Tax=Salegentibacter sp. BLCTC TaxID=2697368 RepID=UPI00187B4EEA|nr:hypothetical protein [Salegentibacter sp. BLCTC]MBE7641462.1 hypothetical protein [Salegentibacter sp. BLCTC]